MLRRDTLPAHPPDPATERGRRARKTRHRTKFPKSARPRAYAPAGARGPERADLAARALRRASSPARPDHERRNDPKPGPGPVQVEMYIFALYVGPRAPE